MMEPLIADASFWPEHFGCDNMMGLFSAVLRKQEETLISSPQSEPYTDEVLRIPASHGQVACVGWALSGTAPGTTLLVCVSACAQACACLCVPMHVCRHVHFCVCAPARECPLHACTYVHKCSVCVSGLCVGVCAEVVCQKIL